MGEKEDMHAPDDKPQEKDQPTGHGIEDSASKAETPTIGPFSGPKAWLILVGILLLIGVAVLYVYQTGDTKTILGNQPIPTLQAFLSPHVPALNVPSGGQLRGSMAAPALQLPPQPAAPAAAPPDGTQSRTLVQCPRCGATGLPLCASCGAVMQRLGNDPTSALFVCPLCGAVGMPICPYCGAGMAATKTGGQQPINNGSRPAGNVGGQFQCPACGATGLPNWTADGTPLCPNCGATMSTTARAAPQLAAAP